MELSGAWEREKRKNDRATVILHTTRCEGRGYKMLKPGVVGRLRESIRRDQTHQSKAHPQRPYIETPF
jgi:hypothetical protein